MSHHATGKTLKKDKGAYYQAKTLFSDRNKLVHYKSKKINFNKVKTNVNYVKENERSFSSSVHNAIRAYNSLGKELKIIDSKELVDFLYFGKSDI